MSTNPLKNALQPLPTLLYTTIESLTIEFEADLQNFLPKNLISYVEKIEENVIAWAHPEVAESRFRPTIDFPLARLLPALFIALWYLIFMYLMSRVLKLIFPEKNESSLQHSGSKENGNGRKVENGEFDEENASVVKKFKNDPVLVFTAVYDLLQIGLCGYMTSQAVFIARRLGYGLICNPFLNEGTEMADIVWVFYMSKMFDFFDTFFIVIRRKWRQLSFLHVYHHFTIFLMYWLNMRVGYDGDIYYTVAANSFIHFIMYTYYFLRTFNIHVPLIFKMMVTNMQMIQFVTMMSQAVYIYFMRCPAPPRMLELYFAYIFSLLLLFNNFARKTYRKKPSPAIDKNKKVN